MVTNTDIQRAARLLEQGRLVAFPTETVYGLGADASNPEAVAAIFAAKGRPSNHPVIVHVARNADLNRWASAIPAEALILTEAFWPGPLTIILPRSPAVPAAVAGGQDSIGLRCPLHPVAQALLAEFRGGQGGIAAPSANRFGHVSPTTAQHVIDEFGLIGDSPIACVLDGGQCEVGIESSIIDLTRLDTVGPVLLRPGQITALQIAEVLGRMPALPDTAAPRVSGSLDAHYAPLTPLALLASEQMTSMMKRLEEAGHSYALLHYAVLQAGLTQQHSQAISAKQLSANPLDYAHQLYASLRALDTAGAAVILVQSPPTGEDWRGINDRLSRAAFDSVGVLDKLLKA